MDVAVCGTVFLVLCGVIYGMVWFDEIYGMVYFSFMVWYGMGMVWFSMV